jgi:hypothetical protein
MKVAKYTLEIKTASSTNDSGKNGYPLVEN